ncbi:hypothetical protein BDV93DRAFT_560704 [Ceratobasidium sp. AG-I]|nr:hypothetical protein BDV93DRAFT_560704 [Ceratobasidium sp. AG-I]
MSSHWSLPSICNACGQQGQLRCTRCSSIWYCSTLCRDYDSTAHSQLCTLFAGATTTSQPAFTTPQSTVLYSGHSQLNFPIHLPPPIVTRHVRAIVLPVNHTNPYLTVVQINGHLSLTGTMQWTPQLDHIEGTSSFPVCVVSLRGPGHIPLRYPLRFHFEVHPDEMISSSAFTPNGCVNALAGGTSHSWKGNIVVLKFNGSRRQGYMNAKERDILAIRYFLLHH